MTLQEAFTHVIVGIVVFAYVLLWSSIAVALVYGACKVLTERPTRVWTPFALLAGVVLSIFLATLMVWFWQFIDVWGEGLVGP